MYARRVSRRAFLRLQAGKLPAGGSQLAQGAAGHHRTQGGHSLHTAKIPPFVFGNGVEPNHPAGKLLGLQQGGEGPILVDGLGVGEDQKRGGSGQGCWLLGG